MIRSLITQAETTWRALKSRRTLWMTVGAICFGALSVLGVRNYIGERLAIEKARLAPRQEMVEVVVARRELKRGELVGADTMAVRSIPRDYVPGGVVIPARFDSVQGMRLQAPMKAGEPLLPATLVAPESAGIAQRLAPGVRAMTIAVDEVNSLSGMLQPGDRIDLLLTVRPLPVQGQPMPEVTRTVIQDVTVLATGRQSRALAPDEPQPARSFTSITVEVDPERAQKLVVAQRSGKLTAVLRHPDDRQPVLDKRLDVNTLLGLPPPSPPAAPATPAGGQAAPAPKPAVPVQAAVQPGPQIIVGGRGPLPSNPSGFAQAASTGPTASSPPASSGTPDPNAGIPPGQGTQPTSIQPAASLESLMQVPSQAPLFR